MPYDLYLPAFWFDVHIVVSEPVASKVGMLATLPDTVVTIGIVAVSASLLGIVFCVALRVRNIVAKRRNSRQFEQVINYYNIS